MKKEKISKRSASKRGDLNPNAKLTAALILGLRMLVAKNGDQRGFKAELARKNGISQGTLADIVSGRRWGWIQ